MVHLVSNFRTLVIERKRFLHFIYGAVHYFMFYFSLKIKIQMLKKKK